MPVVYVYQEAAAMEATESAVINRVFRLLLLLLSSGICDEGELLAVALVVRMWELLVR